jgi:hypothetical protein
MHTICWIAFFMNNIIAFVPFPNACTRVRGKTWRAWLAAAAAAYAYTQTQTRKPSRRPFILLPPYGAVLTYYICIVLRPPMLLIWHSTHPFVMTVRAQLECSRRLEVLPVWRLSTYKADASFFGVHPRSSPAWVDYPCHAYIWLLVLNPSTEKFEDSALVVGISFPKFPHLRRLGRRGYSPTSTSMENSDIVVLGVSKLGWMGSLFCLHMCYSGKCSC